MPGPSYFDNRIPDFFAGSLLGTGFTSPLFNLELPPNGAPLTIKIPDFTKVELSDTDSKISDFFFYLISYQCQLYFT